MSKISNSANSYTKSGTNGIDAIPINDASDSMADIINEATIVIVTNDAICFVVPGCAIARIIEIAEVIINSINTGPRNIEPIPPA